MTDKGSLKEGITLKQNGLLIHDSEEFLNYWALTTTKSLNLSDWGKNATPSIPFLMLSQN